MPKSQFQQTSFASGELSPLLMGRTDLEQYYKGAQTADNVVIVEPHQIYDRLNEYYRLTWYLVPLFSSLP